MFNYIDEVRTNYIDLQNMKRFLLKIGFMPNDNLLIAAIRRMDLDGDAKLNYLEFMDALKPVEQLMDVGPKKKEVQNRP